MSIVDEQKIYDEAKTNNTTSARAQAFNANEQNLAQNGNPLAQAAQGVGWQTPPANTGGTVAEPMTAQKSVAQSANGAGQTQKANIAVDKNVKTTGNVFVKPVTAPNAPTNNGFTPGIGFHTTEIGKNGEQIIPQDQFVPDKNYDKLRVNVPTPSRALTYADFRDAMYGPEAEREKRANRIAKIQAVGDALRHIGNLATTIGSGRMGRAIPQQFKTSPAQQTLAEYKAERKERDAMGYQQLMQHQKQKQQEFENEIKRQKDARDAAKAGMDMAYRDAQTKKIMQDMGIQAEKYPYEIQKLVADTAKAVADGDKAAYEAGMKKIDFEKYPELKNLEIQGAKLKNAKTGADIAHTNALTRKTNEETKKVRTENSHASNSNRTPLPVWRNGRYIDNEEHWVEGKDTEVKAKVVSHLADRALKQGWLKGSGTDITNIKDLTNASEAQISNIYDAIVAHASDSEVQRVFKQLANGNGGGSTTRPGSVVKKGKSAGGGGSSSSRTAD